jgi:hypothetical protein
MGSNPSTTKKAGGGGGEGLEEREIHKQEHAWDFRGEGPQAFQYSLNTCTWTAEEDKENRMWHLYMDFPKKRL